MNRKTSTASAEPLGDYPDFPILDEREKQLPELESYHAKMRVWYYDLRKVLLREREKLPK